MAQINKSNEYFNTVLYTGNGGTNNITGVEFQPDWVWIKNRPDVRGHQIYDSVRGVTKVIGSDRTSAEATVGNGLTAFGSDGFTLGSDSNVNDSGDSHVSWNWLAGGTGVSNTDGSITSTVSANTTAGFSIVSFTNSGSGNRTVGHGLNAKPKMIIQHAINDATNWLVYNENLNSSPENYYLYLNTTNAVQNITNIWGAGMTTTTFGINAGVGGTTSYINYCFAEKKGFSKFGSYTGNGSTDGTFVYTGFKPAFVMVKRSDAPEYWNILDTARADVSNANPTDQVLYANDASAEYSETQGIDLLSNGFKVRESGAGWCNASGGTYIYMCFAENPLVGTNNIPATAR